MTYVLLDKDEHYKVSALISAVTTTADELQDIIWKMEREIDGYTDDDLVDYLPDDCTIHWLFDDEIVEW